MWGSLMKVLMYFHFKKMERFLEKPINVLILMDMICNHFVLAVFVIQYLAALVLDSTFIELLRSEFQIEIDAQVTLR